MCKYGPVVLGRVPHGAIALDQNLPDFAASLNRPRPMERPLGHHQRAPLQQQTFLACAPDGHRYIGAVLAQWRRALELLSTRRRRACKKLILYETRTRFYWIGYTKVKSLLVR